MKNRKGNLLMALGLLLLLAAVALVGYNQWDSNRAGQEAEEALIALEQIRFQQRLNAQQTAAPTTAAPTVSVTDALSTQVPRGDAAVTAVPATEAPVTPVPATHQPTANAAPTVTKVPQPTASAAPTATQRPQPTASAAPTATQRPQPTATQAPQPTDTPAPTDTPQPTDTPAPTDTPEPTATLIPMPTGALYERVPGIEMPGQEVNGHEYIGNLSIPSLGLDLPIQRNWSYPNLSVSPCRYSGSAYSGEFVIIAHTYPTHFGKLNSLSIGATVSFTDMDGNVFRYVVREKETLSPTDANELAHSGYDLTLATCTLSGTKRLVVHCDRQK